MKMIVERMGMRRVLIRTRDENGLRKEQIISKYYPFGFLLDEDAEFCPALSKESGYTGVYGESLTKVVMGDPTDVGNLKNKYAKTWECNIPWTNRALSEYNKENPPIPNYVHRVWYLDMEWKTDETITIISVYDNYKKSMFTWAVEPDAPYKGHSDTLRFKNHPYGVEERKLDIPMLLFPNEKDMLEHFIKFMRQCDPDVITGWNVVNADVRVIIERCAVNNINPKDMCGGSSRKIQYNFTDWAQPIGGRMCIDLMLCVSKLWQLKNGALPNKKLDTVAKEILQEEKLPLADGHDTYYTDFDTYVDYNIQDVELLPKLDKAVNAINHHLAIQHIVQCDIQTTPFVTRLFTALTINDDNFHYCIPSKPQFPHKDYSGADIMEPTPGIYKNVAIMDIKAMYHSNAALHNISWETLDSEGKDCGNGSKFHHKHTGHLVRQMDKMTKLRNEYKALMKEADDPDDKAMYDAMQYATKSLVASMYGAAGDSKYGLYHPDVAAAITFTSRKTLFRLRDESEALGMNVIYGHTDSIFVECPSPEVGVDCMGIINKNMAPIETEFEKWCSGMVIKAKNRYAGMTSWTDGEHHSPKLYVKGIELKQGRLPTIMKEVMSSTITAMLTDVPESEVTDKLSTTIQDIVGGNVSIKDLCIKARLTDNLENYKVLGESRAGAAWANRVLGKGYRKGSDFLSTIDSEGNYIAFDDPSDIDGIAKVGFREIADKFILKKVEDYYRIAKWDIQPLHNALNGVSNTEWL